MIAGVVDGRTIDVGTAGSRCGAGVGHFLRVGAGDAHQTHRDAQAVGGHLRHLGVQSLAHFGAAVVHADGTVLIDVDQRAALIEHGGGKRNAELQRHQCQTALAVLALRIEVGNGFAPRRVVGLAGHLLNHLVAHPVLNGLPVLRGHGAGVA